MVANIQNRHHQQKGALTGRTPLMLFSEVNEHCALDSLIDLGPKGKGEKRETGKQFRTCQFLQLARWLNPLFLLVHLT